LRSVTTVVFFLLESKPLVHCSKVNVHGAVMSASTEMPGLISLEELKSLDEKCMPWITIHTAKAPTLGSTNIHAS